MVLPYLDGYNCGQSPILRQRRTRASERSTMGVEQGRFGFSTEDRQSSSGSSMEHALDEDANAQVVSVSARRASLSLNAAFSLLDSVGIADLAPPRSDGKRGLPDYIIDKLPVEEAKAPANTADRRECMICCQDVVEDDKIKWLPCFHRFHLTCIDSWLATKGACPACRLRVTSALFKGQAMYSEDVTSSKLISGELASA
eukprot:GHVO01032578.1.p1 GENE.GHVO01032578.1~~GHVO01032578.1.p1  ORF type:complete len:200 (+),score=5.50 GHVO01032578.1:102-701(+)